jgi:hypothetical protein
MTQDYTPVGPSTPPIETQDRTPKKSFPWNKVLIFGCGGCAVVGALVIVFGGWGLLRLGLGVFSDEVESELRSNPVIIEHIGRIEEFDLDLSASIAEEGGEDFVFRVSGTKGSGLVSATCVTNDDGIEEVVAGTIQLESGETLDLFPEAESAIEEPE